MPTENRFNDAAGWIACDDGLHLIQMDENLSHYGWVFRKVDGGLPYSVREATPHEISHAQARQHLRIGVAQISGQAPAQQHQGQTVASKKLHIEVRECESCNHIGIDDSHSTMSACHNCEWSGPEPVEDKCPDCDRENCMAAACPDCGSRYVLATSKTIDVASDPTEVERLRAALRFYADREHYHFESGNWDTVSGEPLNILWCGEEPDFIEDGTVARNALSASAEPSAPLPTVDGDLLPPIGSKVLIHLARENEWMEHTVVGYYVWENLRPDPGVHRVFVRVRDVDGYLNARGLADIRPAVLEHKP